MTTGWPTEGCEYLTLAFSPTSAPLQSRWRNNGLSADFLGDYVTTFLPGQNGTAKDKRQNEIKYAVTYIANELLENAMKYHQREVDVPITIHLKLASEHITVSVSNAVGPNPAKGFRAFLEQMRREDPTELMMRQQEETARDSSSTSSCLGLLTMICDYDAELDWAFDVNPQHPETVTVTMSAILPLASVPGVSA